MVRRAGPGRADGLGTIAWAGGESAWPRTAWRRSTSSSRCWSALEGLTTAVRMDSAPDRSSLWAGLFDLRENLLGGTLEDLRALAA